MINKFFWSGVFTIAILSFSVAGAVTADEKQSNEKQSGEKQSDLVKLAIGLFGETDKDLRSLGFDQVRTEAKGAAATKAFAAELSKLPADGQIGLLSALADRGDTAARPAVLDILSVNNIATVKVAAISALGKLGNTDDVKLLVTHLDDESVGLAPSAARASLIALGGETTPAAIAAAIKTSSPAVRITLVEILAARRALDALPAITEAAVDANAHVRYAAMIALGQLAGPEQVVGMAAGILKAEPGAERDAAEKALALACSQAVGSDKRAKPLLDIIARSGEVDRLALLPALGRIGGGTALNLIEAELADAQPAHHAAGVRALCNWPDASVAPLLFELAKADLQPDLRASALTALIRLAPMNDGRPDGERLEATKQVMLLCKTVDDQNRLLKRAGNVRMLETLQYVLPYLEKSAHAQTVCETIVEMAHHRGLREPNKVHFDAALDKVIAISKDPVVVDRAGRYKKGQTWERPKAGE